MTVKLTGKQWNQFCDQKWPDNLWVEEEEIWVDEVLQEDEVPVNNTALVKIVGGTIYTASSMPFETYLRKWLKALSTVSFVVTVDKDKAEEVKAAVKRTGGKVEK